VRPSDYSPDGEYPLIVMLHGYGVNAELQDYIFGFQDRVDRDQFLLLMPEGTIDDQGSRFWNATPECCDFDGTHVDDSAYLSGLVTEAESLYPISQVSFVGHSNGGYMSYRMACDHPDQIARIVVLAGAVFKDEDLCTGTTPVSVAHIHGTLDGSVVYTSTALHAGAEESVGRWTDKAGCAEPPVRLADREYVADVLGAETLIDRWSGCSEGIDIELWTGMGVDHTWITRTARFQDDVTAFALGNPAD
jgi:polyhydroxybutyrate depolymerase